MALHCIGIAGYMGSGKTTCCRLLAGAGEFRIIDGDKKAKAIMNRTPALREKIAAAFGSGVVENNLISFSNLGEVVFSDSEKLRRLNTLVHPLLLERLHKTIFKKRAGVVVIDAALLPLWNIDEWFDLRLWIDASFGVRFGRLVRKLPALSEEKIIRRMRVQEMLFGAPTSASWIHIVNEGDCDHLMAAVWACIHGSGNGRPSA
ncbi:MAG: dephospho-CoA kinase [Chitinispirillaceae bacterium]|nr:dephospho-CoA kinase [Chitinispirillaceae bacterium]